MNRNFLKYVLVTFGFALSMCSTAHGLVFRPNPHGPEIDPGLAVSGLTLLAGTLAILRIRRNK